MVALRSSLFGAVLAPFGLGAVFFAIGSTPTGTQDLGAVVTRAPAALDRTRESLIASPFGTIHAAVFSLPRPVGTMMPDASERVVLANFDPQATDLTAPAAREPDRWQRPPGRSEGPPTPDVNRSAKGDLLIPRVQIEINRELVVGLKMPDDPDLSEADELEAAQRFRPFPEYDISLSLELDPKLPPAHADNGSEADDPTAADDGEDARTAFGTARLYFEPAPLTARLAAIEPWAPGEAPVLMLPAARANPDGGDPAAALSADRSGLEKPPVTVAPKGQAPGEALGLSSPAALLKLSVKTRAKAERCLANAIYFESRSESTRGQIAVAQVVLNRVFSGYYPSDVCGVVYQGAHRHLSCQFTFACDGIPDVVTEPEAWERAKRIATAALDGRIWLKEIGKATHYHAFWVNPYWVHSMKRLHKIGVHSFYRPRRWGDGSDEPTWGKSTNAEMAARL